MNSSKSPDPHSRWEGVREIGRMAGPVVIGSLSFTLMQFVDVLFVSWLGAEQLAAIGSAGIWSYTLGVFFLGITGCVSTFVSQSYGRGQKENCGAYAWQGIYISLTAGAGALIVWPFADDLFGLMGHSAEVTRLETIYLRVRTFGFVFIAWQTALSSFFQAVNRPTVPMYVAIVANVINIALDWLLIFPHGPLPGWGIGGAALATVIALGMQVVMLQYFFLHPAMDAEYATRRRWQIDWVKAKDLFRIGWPSGVTTFLDVAAWSVFTSVLVGRFGTTQLAAHTAAMQYMHLAFIPALALNYAVTPIVGQWIGRGNIPIAKQRTWTATRIAIAYMVTVAFILAVFGRPLMGVFSVDPDVIDLGRVLLILAAIFAGFDAISIVISGALRGAGDTRWMMTTMIIGAYGFSLPLAWFFSTPMELGARGAWIGATIYIIGLSGAFYWRFQSEKWRHIRIFSEDLPHPPVEIPTPGPGDTVPGDTKLPV